MAECHVSGWLSGDAHERIEPFGDPVRPAITTTDDGGLISAVIAGSGTPSTATYKGPPISEDAMVTIPCAAPHCGRPLDPGDDHPQLDVPGQRFRLFCDLRCLHVWAMHHGQTAFRDIGQGE